MFKMEYIREKFKINISKHNLYTWCQFFFKIVTNYKRFTTRSFSSVSIQQIYFPFKLDAVQSKVSTVKNMVSMSQCSPLFLGI